MTPTDEMLAAYVDGELDLATRLQIEGSVAGDPVVAARIAALRSLNRTLGRAFGGILAEPVPERLLEAVRLAPSSAVVDMAQAHASPRRRERRRWALPEWSAVAASVVVGLTVGRFGLTHSTPAFVASDASGIVAGPALAAALTGRLAAEGASADGVGVQLSFRTKNGEQCRTFTVEQQSVAAGVACHVRGQWRIRVLAESGATHPEPGAYRLAAGSLPPAVLAAVTDSIAGEPFDAPAEAAARQSGWK